MTDMRRQIDNEPLTGAGGNVDAVDVGTGVVVGVVGMVHVRFTRVFLTRLRLLKLTA